MDDNSEECCGNVPTLVEPIVVLLAIAGVVVGTVECSVDVVDIVIDDDDVDDEDDGNSIDVADVFSRL